MVNKDDISTIVSDLKSSRYINNQEYTKDRKLATKGRENVYTEGKSKIAFLPYKAYKSIMPGSLITANDVTRYVLSKNDNDQSVVLNKSANWNNVGYGYPFEYYNPISKMLDPANDIVGYITRSGLIHLAKSVPLNIDTVNLLSEKIYVSDTNGLMILNQNDTGLYVTSEGEVYVGSVDNWVSLNHSANWGHIDGNIYFQNDLMKLLGQKINKPNNFVVGNLSQFSVNGDIIDTGVSLSTLCVDGGSF
jgi:hypothetical protein